MGKFNNVNKFEIHTTESMKSWAAALKKQFSWHKKNYFQNSLHKFFPTLLSTIL